MSGAGAEQRSLEGVAVDDEPNPMVAWAEAASLDEMMAYSVDLLHRVQAEHRATHALTGTLGLFSGGNDSTTFMHLLRGEFDSAVHINTGIGIAETRAYVRASCEAWGLDLHVGHPPKGATYRDLVLAHGFPGPAGHMLMYTRLKERALREVRRAYVNDHRTERVLFVAGMRYFESDRRSRNTEETHRDGSLVWCSPLMWWTNRHMAEYRDRFDVPRNEVSDHIHMSGECLCGSFAKPGELEMIRFFYPETAAEIEQLQRDAKAVRVHCLWGTRPPPRNRTSHPVWVCMCTNDHHEYPDECPYGTWSAPSKAAGPVFDADDDETVGGQLSMFDGVGLLCASCEVAA